jgi:ubiquinone/menaquinone biosynthesis C-methylase UbiE
LFRSSATAVTPDGEAIARFDRWSRTYEGSWLQRLFFDRVHRAVLALVAREVAPESLLDVGCGTGRLLRKAQACWPAAQPIGVDPAPGMIDMARRLTPGATFYVRGAEALPLPDASVDVAVSTAAFHHWQDPLSGLREISRVLRPGGHFFLADPTMPVWLSKLFPHFGSNRSHQPAALRQLFAQAGLQVQGQHRVRSLFLLVTIAVRPEDSRGS